MIHCTLQLFFITLWLSEYYFILFRVLNTILHRTCLNRYLSRGFREIKMVYHTQYKLVNFINTITNMLKRIPLRIFTRDVVFIAQDEVPERPHVAAMVYWL